MCIETAQSSRRSRECVQASSFASAIRTCVGLSGRRSQPADSMTEAPPSSRPSHLMFIRRRFGPRQKQLARQLNRGATRRVPRPPRAARRFPRPSPSQPSSGIQPDRACRGGAEHRQPPAIGRAFSPRGLSGHSETISPSLIAGQWRRIRASTLLAWGLTAPQWSGAEHQSLQRLNAEWAWHLRVAGGPSTR